MPPAVAKGKRVVAYSLPEKLIERIGTKAVRERKRACEVAERLLVRGIQAEADDKKAEPEAESAQLPIML